MYKVTIEHDEGSATRHISYLFNSPNQDAAWSRGKRLASAKGFKSKDTVVHTQQLLPTPVIE